MPNITNPNFSSLFLTFHILPKGRITSQSPQLCRSPHICPLRRTDIPCQVLPLPPWPSTTLLILEKHLWLMKV